MSSTTPKDETEQATPRIETRVEKVPGKNLLIHQTIITDVKPIAYYNAVIAKADSRIDQDPETKPD